MLFEDFDPDIFVQHKAVIMVVATYGEGDPTDNAVEFYKWIHEDGREQDCLKGMNFAVMGLGNRPDVILINSDMYLHLDIASLGFFECIAYRSILICIWYLCM